MEHRVGERRRLEVGVGPRAGVEPRAEVGARRRNDIRSRVLNVLSVGHLFVGWCRKKHDTLILVF